VKELLKQYDAPQQVLEIGEKILDGIRITPEDGIILYKEADTALLAALASVVRERKNGDKVFFNRNFHIEPTNICIHSCKFCSYVRKKGEEGAWEYSMDEMLKQVEKYKDKKVTEVHIVGGVHPDRDLWFYCDLLKNIKAMRPDLQIKAFTAVELAYMIEKAGLDYSEGLQKLKEAGLQAIPGGGAEIFDEEIRKQVCSEKASTAQWLEIHRAAHLAGIPSNATILYGHVENYAHRIDHMNRLRQLQDEAPGFDTFIPLKYRKENNSMSFMGEVSLIEDMRNYAVSRIFLNNIQHIKAYWPMLGRDSARLSLAFGVDDLDGTIDDTTKIYSMAGVEEKPSMTSNDLIQLINTEGYTAIERDTFYNELNIWKPELYSNVSL
jgi:aminodeoxyfutalosine synthase